MLSEINLWLVGPEITKAGAKVQPKRVSTPPQLPTTTTMRFPGVSLKNAWDDAKTGWAFCSTNDGFYTKNDGLCASSCLCTPRAGKFTSNPHHNAISRENLRDSCTVAGPRWLPGASAARSGSSFLRSRRCSRRTASQRQPPARAQLSVASTRNVHPRN